MMFRKIPFLMAPEDESGSAGAIDRGDDADALPPSTIDDTAEVEAKAAADAAAAAEELAARGDEGEDEEKPRDESGKFTKKTRDVPDLIPRAEFDKRVSEQRQAREAAEGRLRELQSQLQTVDRHADNQKLEGDIANLEQHYMKLMMDGEAEKAASVMKDIRLKERQIGISSSTAMTEQAKEQAREEMRMELTIEKLESTYEEFNPDHKDFDPGLVDMVLALQRHKIAQGLSPSKALVSAATDIMSRLGSDGGKGEVKGLAAARGADRKAEQVAKNLDASRRQPASTRVAGKDSDKAGDALPNVAGMTMSEFAALPESTKSKLRGDTI